MTQIKAEKIISETSDILAQHLYEYHKGNMELYDYQKKRQEIIKRALARINLNLMGKIKRFKEFLRDREYDGLVKEFNTILQE